IDLLHGELAVHAVGRPTLAGKVARIEFHVDLPIELLDTSLDADRDADAGLGAGEPPAVVAEVTGEGRALHALRRGAPGEAGRLQVGERLRRHAAEPPDVVWNAVRVGAVEHRAANGRAGGG